MIFIIEKIVVTSIALSSMVFMGLVFFYEGILGHGITFIEPNLTIARIELATIGLGIVLTLRHFVKDISKLRE